MDQTAQIIIDKLNSLERRIERVEQLLQVQSSSSSPPMTKKKLSSFKVAGAKNLFFHYKSPGFQNMENVLNELVQNISPSSNREINVYAEYVTGRPDLAVDGRQFKGFTILLFVASPGSTDIIGNTMYRDAHFDAQIVIELDGSFSRINFVKSRKEIQKFNETIRV